MSRHDSDCDSDKYASKGVAGAGLGLGIAGTALGLLRDGGLGGLFGGWGGYRGYPGHGGWGYGDCGGGSQLRWDEREDRREIFRLAQEIPFLALAQQKEFCHYAIENERRLACIEATNAANRANEYKNAEIARLRDALIFEKTERYTDDKTCKKLDADLCLRPSQLADPYMGQRNVISTHAPVVEVERKHNECGEHRRMREWY